MKALFLDTCVWIYLVTDRKREPVLARLERLVSGGKMFLIVPWIVEEEFAADNVDIKKKLAAGYASHVAQAKEVVDLLPDNQHDSIRAALDEVIRLLKSVEVPAIERRLHRISALWRDATTRRIEESDAIHAAVGRRARKEERPKGPDATIFESFLSFMPGTGEDVVFITENVNDFSDPKERRKPHPELAAHFSTRGYSNNIADVLETIDPGGLAASVEHIDKAAVGHCVVCGGPIYNAGWRRSMVGLSWHHFCPRCNRWFDTGDAWD